MAAAATVAASSSMATASSPEAPVVVSTAQPSATAGAAAMQPASTTAAQGSTTTVVSSGTTSAHNSHLTSMSEYERYANMLTKQAQTFRDGNARCSQELLRQGEDALLLLKAEKRREQASFTFQPRIFMPYQIGKYDASAAKAARKLEEEAKEKKRLAAPPVGLKLPDPTINTAPLQKRKTYNPSNATVTEQNRRRLQMHADMLNAGSASSRTVVISAQSSNAPTPNTTPSSATASTSSSFPVSKLAFPTVVSSSSSTQAGPQRARLSTILETRAMSPPPSAHLAGAVATNTIGAGGASSLTITTTPSSGPITSGSKTSSCSSGGGPATSSVVTTRQHVLMDPALQRGRAPFSAHQNVGVRFQSPPETGSRVSSNSLPRRAVGVRQLMASQIKNAGVTISYKVPLPICNLSPDSASSNLPTGNFIVSKTTRRVVRRAGAPPEGETSSPTRFIPASRGRDTHPNPPPSPTGTRIQHGDRSPTTVVRLGDHGVQQPGRQSTVFKPISPASAGQITSTSTSVLAASSLLPSQNAKDLYVEKIGGQELQHPAIESSAASSTTVTNDQEHHHQIEVVEDRGPDVYLSEHLLRQYFQELREETDSNTVTSTSEVADFYLDIVSNATSGHDSGSASSAVESARGLMFATNRTTTRYHYRRGRARRRQRHRHGSTSGTCGTGSSRSHSVPLDKHQSKDLEWLDGLEQPLHLAELPEEILFLIFDYLSHKEKFYVCIASSRQLPHVWGVVLVFFSKALQGLQQQCEEQGVLTDIASTKQTDAQQEWQEAIATRRMMCEDVRRFDRNTARFELDLAELLDVENERMAKFQAAVQVLAEVMNRWSTMCRERDETARMCSGFHAAIAVTFAM
ncbi:unnamed protein product [Amoebophrya sp. A120]|nr:unnamed protein product [Amoebophrya sp. A120]|eukprot:GSA120T00022687001.1